MTSSHCSSQKSSTNIHTSRHKMAKMSPEQQLKSFVGVRRYLFLLSDRSLIEDDQKTPHNKFTFDSERDSPESEICREVGKDGRDCMTVCGSCLDLCFTETTRLPTPVEDELQAAVRVYAGSWILLCSAVRPLANSHGMHSYTKELRVTPNTPKRGSSCGYGCGPHSHRMNCNVHVSNNNQPIAPTHLSLNPRPHHSRSPTSRTGLSLLESQRPPAASSLQPTRSPPSPVHAWLSEMPSKSRHILHASNNFFARVRRSSRSIRNTILHVMGYGLPSCRAL